MSVVNKINPIDNKKVKGNQKKKQEVQEVSQKIGELQICCQLFRNNLDREKDIKENRKAEQNPVVEKIETKIEPIKVEPIKAITPQEEVKVDYDGILALYLNITNIKPIENQKVSQEASFKNYFISHKIFPNSEVSTSEIFWHSINPNLNYEMLMPFTLNSRTIELLESNSLTIELWHKSNSDDELIGTVKLELNPFLESLKISEDTLSIAPLSKSLIPLIVYDGFFPVYNFDELRNFCFLNVTLGLGTTTQVNNLIRKNKQVEIEMAKPKKVNENNMQMSNNMQNNLNNMQNSNNLDNFNKQSSIIKNHKINDEEFNMLNHILNVEKDGSILNKEKQEDIDVESILERNKRELENVNTKYKVSMSSMADTRKYEGNPFLVDKNIQIENVNKNTKDIFCVSKESNFYFGEMKKNETEYLNDKLTENDFFKSANLKDLKELKELKDFKANEILPENKTIPDFKSIKEEIIEPVKVKVNSPNKYNSNIDIQDSQINYIQKIIHKFEIFIDKLYNLQILSKLNGNAYIKYKFLNQSESEQEKEEVKSDTLLYSTYDKEKSVIIVDMKTSHSLLLSPDEKIRDFLHDFSIALVYNNEEEIVFGKVSLPVEEILTIINRGSNNYLDSTLFIYGTEKIKRQDCIIGKMKMQIKYEYIAQSNESSNILMEKQVVINRKIPKKAILVFKVNYFKYDDKFLEIFDVNTGVFYFEIDPFSEDKKFKKMYPKQYTSKKYYSLNGIFEEEFHFEIDITPELFEYLKDKYAILNFVVYNKIHNFVNSEISSDSDNHENSQFKEIVGSTKVQLSEIISNTDVTTKNYRIINSNGSSLGSVNLEMKLENNTNDEEKKKINKKLTIGKTAKLDNLKDIIREKKEKKFDGKYYLVLNLANLIFDENFLKKFDSNSSNTNIGNKFFLTYNFGKNTKKVSPIFDKEDSELIIESPFSIFIHKLDFIEILELNLNFTKNKPEETIKALIENILEIKLFMGENNNHIGSFMVDIGKIFSSENKLSENSKIFYSDIVNIDFFNSESKIIESTKLSMNICLINTEFNSFKNFYLNLVKATKQNQEVLKSICCATNSNTYSNSNDIKKKIKSFLNFIHDEFNVYEYINELINLEDENGEVIIPNLIKFLSIVYDFTFDSTLLNYQEDVNSIFTQKVINLKKKSLIELNCPNYIVHKDNFDCLFPNKEIVNVYVTEEILNKNKSKFGIYNSEKERNFINENKIDLFNFLIFLYKNYKHESMPYRSKSSRNMHLEKLSLVVFSCSNITLNTGNQQAKPNCYFNFTWGEDQFTSDVIFKTTHPSWNQKLEINIDSSTITQKFNSDIIITIFSKNFAKSFYNEKDTSNNFEKDEYIGEVVISPMEIAKYKFLNDKNEYEDYFNIYNNQNIRGQLNVAFIFEDSLLKRLNMNLSNNTEAATNFNFNLSKKNKTEDFYLSKYTCKTTKKYQFDELSNLDTEMLWAKLNKDSEIINKLTKEIDLNHSEVNEVKNKTASCMELGGYSQKRLDNTIDRERRITDEIQSNSNILNNLDLMEMDEINIPENRSKYDNDMNELLNSKNLGQANINMSLKSFNMDVDVLDKPYSDFRHNLDMQQIENMKEKNNQSMFDNLRKNSKFSKINKPPLPAYNLYKNADKQFLNRIQNILKNKENKKLSYVSSDDEK